MNTCLHYERNTCPFASRLTYSHSELGLSSKELGRDDDDGDDDGDRRCWTEKIWQTRKFTSSYFALC